MTSQDYFVDGGTLQPDDPSYVTRPADYELLEKVQAGAFCYVLTARQMGKSSLMIRAAQKLREQGTKVALVDLTAIGVEASADQWYLGLLTSIIRELELEVDVEAFWQKNLYLPAKQRFINFLHDVVLQKIKGKIAIFIDEIDSALSISFGDDFFAGIRAIYGARARDIEYNRLTFVLLGVATPTDLMKDVRMTPFNIGSRIVVQEFSFDDAKTLHQGLEKFYPGQGEQILRRIFYWTNGHPYLTQHLCRIATKPEILEDNDRQLGDLDANHLLSEESQRESDPMADVIEWDDQKLDNLVARRFFSEESRRDSNLAFVRDRIRAMKPDIMRQEMLKLYNRVYTGELIKDDDRSQPQLYLKLFGLIRAEQGNLRVCNEIYRRVFNQAWVAENLRTSQSEQVAPTKRRYWLYVGVSIGLVILATAIFLLIRSL